MTALVQQKPKALDVPAVGEFIERSMSKATKQTYSLAIEQFFVANPVNHPSDVTPAQVRAYRDKLAVEGMKPHTIRLKLAAIRALFEYLKRAHVVSDNPADGYLVVSPPRPDSIKDDGLSVEEVNQLLAGPDLAEPADARDYAMMLFMLRTSARVAEVCGIRLSDIKRISVKGGKIWTVDLNVKGGYARTIPLPDDVKEAIDGYLQLDKSRRQKAETDKEDSFVFQPLVNNRTENLNKPISRVRAWQVVQKWCDVAGLKRRGPHAFRRTAITRAFDLEMPLREVQAMSGHKTVDVLLKYDQHRRSLNFNAINKLNYQSDTE